VAQPTLDRDAIVAFGHECSTPWVATRLQLVKEEYRFAWQRGPPMSGQGTGSWHLPARAPSAQAVRDRDCPVPRSVRAKSRHRYHGWSGNPLPRRRDPAYLKITSQSPPPISRVVGSKPRWPKTWNSRTGLKGASRRRPCPERCYRLHDGAERLPTFGQNRADIEFIVRLGHCSLHLSAQCGLGRKRRGGKVHYRAWGGSLPNG
jgi:hypothetical protein